MKTKNIDQRLCADCGTEYMPARGPHECDPRVLAQLKRDAEADQEVRRAGEQPYFCPECGCECPAPSDMAQYCPRCDDN